MLSRAVIADAWDRSIIANAIAFGTALVTREVPIRQPGLVAPTLEPRRGARAAESDSLLMS